jgi:GNAT superfamily N-acetyltransferase
MLRIHATIREPRRAAAFDILKNDDRGFTMPRVKLKSREEAFEKYGWEFKVNFDIQKHVERDATPAEYYDLVYADIVRYRGWGDRETKIGEMELVHFRIIEALQQEADLYRIFDFHSSETEALYKTLIDKKTGSFKPEALGAFPERPVISSILHIARLGLEPRYRGLGLGLLVVNRAIDTFAHWTTIVTVQPWPKEYSLKQRFIPYEDDSNKTKSGKDSHKRVQRFWESVGFKRIAKSKVFIFNPDD